MEGGESTLGRLTVVLCEFISRLAKNGGFYMCLCGALFLWAIFANEGPAFQTFLQLVIYIYFFSFFNYSKASFSGLLMIHNQGFLPSVV